MDDVTRPSQAKKRKQAHKSVIEDSETDSDSDNDIQDPRRRSKAERPSRRRSPASTDYNTKVHPQDLELAQAGLSPMQNTHKRRRVIEIASDSDESATQPLDTEYAVLTPATTATGSSLSVLAKACQCSCSHPTQLTKKPHKIVFESLVDIEKDAIAYIEAWEALAEPKLEEEVEQKACQYVSMWETLAIQVEDLAGPNGTSEKLNPGPGPVDDEEANEEEPEDEDDDNSIDTITTLALDLDPVGRQEEDGTDDDDATISDPGGFDTGAIDPDDWEDSTPTTAPTTVAPEVLTVDNQKANIDANRWHAAGVTKDRRKKSWDHAPASSNEDRPISAQSNPQRHFDDAFHSHMGGAYGDSGQDDGSSHVKAVASSMAPPATSLGLGRLGGTP